MTTGTKTASILMDIALNTTDAADGHIITTTSGVVGIYDVKTWSGADAPSSRLPKEWETLWTRVSPAPRKSVSSKGKRKKREQERSEWRLRRVLKRPSRVAIRTHRGHHDYHMTSVRWFDRVYQYMIKQWTPPQGWVAVERREDTFRRNYGDGFSLQNYAWSSNDDIRLLGKLRERIAGSDFNAGVALAEGKKTLAMITETAVRLRRALQSFRRADPAGVAEALGLKSKPRLPSSRGTDKELAGRWLELQYGWMPLVKDLEGGAHALAHQYSDIPRSQRVFSRTFRPLEWSTVSEGNLPKSQVSMKGGIWGQYIAYITEVDLPALYGLQDVASIAWETLPYSFVADWAIPFSQYLSARGLSTSVSGTFVKTITKRAYYDCKGRGVVIADNTDPINSPGYWYDQVSVDRTVSSSLNVPLPTVKPLNTWLSWKRAANAVALLINFKR